MPLFRARIPCHVSSPVTCFDQGHYFWGLGVSSLVCGDELHSDGGSSVLQVMELAFLSLLFEVGGAPIYPIFSLREHAVDETGQISCHRLHRFAPTSESSPQGTIAGPQIAVAVVE